MILGILLYILNICFYKEMYLSIVSEYKLSINYFFSISQSHKYLNFMKVYLCPTSLSLSFSLLHVAMKKCKFQFPKTCFIYRVSKTLNLPWSFLQNIFQLCLLNVAIWHCPGCRSMYLEYDSGVSDCPYSCFPQ